MCLTAELSLQPAEVTVIYPVLRQSREGFSEEETLGLTSRVTKQSKMGREEQPEQRNGMCGPCG